MPFIVLEGLDGAGKSTQIREIEVLARERGRDYEYLHFPRFDASVWGDLIARFLRGDMGSLESVDPYVVALLFAGDRADAAPQIRRWLEEGKAVILDRYVYSNVAYQCAKVHDPAAKEALKQWIISLEYDYYGIPRPDVSLFLDVPFGFTERKLAEEREGDDRSYLGGKKDIHEASLDLQRSVREMYLSLSSGDGSFRVVDCADTDGGMLPPGDIAVRIRREIEGIL